MKLILFTFLLITVHSCTATLCLAQSPVSPAAQSSANDQAKLNELVQAQQGVYPDFENGVLKRAYIVVSIPIPKSMQPASAKKFAFTRASVQASGEFIKWLKQNVYSKTIDNQQVIVQNKGESNANGNSNSEQTNDTTNTSFMTSIEADGVARGIISRTYQLKDGELVAIFGWSQKLNRAAAQAEKLSQVGSRVAPAQPVVTENSFLTRCRELFARLVAPAQPPVEQNASELAPGVLVQPLQEKEASATNLSDF
jgi:hypothetical protein